MKKSIFITVALFAFTSSTNQLFAQETVTKQRTKSNNTNERTAGYDLKKNVKCRISSTETGCIIVFDGIGGITGGAVAGKNGKASPKLSYSCSVSASDNSVTEVKSPRDVATGQSSGKRQHKPITVTKEYNASTPKLAEIAVSSSDSPPSEIAIDEPGVHKTGAGAGKASFSDLSVMSAGKASFKEFTVTKRCNGKTTKIDCSNGECDIPLEDCPNGDCAITADWSWGLSQSGTMSSGSGASGLSRCSVNFVLQIEDGACTAMAINEKGLPGEKKPNTKTSNNPK